jgi:hypothetical protein
MKKLKITAPKIFALMLLGLIADAHAADSYDPSSQTLTIPQVVVNDTTFTNVVVRLKDFELLRFDPVPLVGVVDNGFLFLFKSAALQGNQLKVILEFTSQAKDRTASVGYQQNWESYYDAKLTDDKGNLYEPKSILVGNVSGLSYSPAVVSKYPFAADITTTVTLTYDNIATNATGIGLLDVHLLNTGDNSKPAYKIRNIPFQIPNNTTPLK